MDQQPEIGKIEAPAGIAAQNPPAAQATEMVSMSAAELEQLRSALKQANAEAAKRRKELEAVEADRKAKAEAEMTELQRAQQRMAELEQALRQRDIADLQRAAAEKAGIPTALASRLHGATAEEIEADAAELVKLLAISKPQPQAAAVAANPGPAATQVRESDAERRRRLGI